MIKFTNQLSYESEIKKRYSAISKRSFKAKLDVYLFKMLTETGHLHDVSTNNFSKYQSTYDWIKRYELSWQKKEGRYPAFSKLTLDEIDKQIDGWKKNNTTLLNELEQDYIETFTLTLSDLKELYPEKPEQRVCGYCSSTEVEINQYRDIGVIRAKTYRGDTLEIDRKEPNEEYHKENLVLACYWCNNAKTDEFSEDEFKQIGVQIRLIWEERYKKIKHPLSERMKTDGSMFSFGEDEDSPL